MSEGTPLNLRVEQKKEQVTRLGFNAIGQTIDIVAAGEKKDWKDTYDVLTLQNNFASFDIESTGVPWISNVRFQRELTTSEVGYTPYTAHPDTTSPEFIVGGINSTQTIRSLQGLNGQTIAELEKILRPSEKGIEPRSRFGFLTPDQSLLAVLTADNDYVQGLGLTHQEMAFPIRYFSELTRTFPVTKFAFQGIEYEILGGNVFSTQASPFGDHNTRTGEYRIKNIATGQELEFDVILGNLIERWGFYEGPGLKYRLDPKDIFTMFPYLQELSKQRLTKPK